MGRKSFRNEKQITKIYEKYKKLTDNYSKFSAEFFVENPKVLLIIRLACEMSQRQFSNIIDFDRSALVHSEIGISKRMKLGNAKKIFSKLQEFIKKADFSEDNVLRNYRKFIYQANQGQSPENLRKFGRKALRHKKPTTQEERISKILKRMRILHEREGILTLDEMDFVFEFLIPNSRNPKVIIECKRAETKSKRNLKIIGYRIAYEIGYKSYLIHKNFPKAKILVVVEHNQKNFPERVNKILNNETDSLLINSNENEISSALKVCRALG